MHSFKPIKASELKEEVEEFMKEFDENEAIEKVEREKRTREPDEEGFVVVKQRYYSSLNNFYHAFFAICFFLLIELMFFSFFPPIISVSFSSYLLFSFS